MVPCPRQGLASFTDRCRDPRREPALGGFKSMRGGAHATEAWLWGSVLSWKRMVDSGGRRRPCAAMWKAGPSTHGGALIGKQAFSDSDSVMKHKALTSWLSAHRGGLNPIGGLVTLLVLVGSAGCGVSIDNIIPPSGVLDGNVGVQGKPTGEPNGSFPQALEAVFDGSAIAHLQGTIEIIGDMDVYDIGPLARGDLLTVDADTPTSSLDVAVAIFDGQQRLVYYNDDRGGTSIRALDSYIEWAVRHDSDIYYLAVSHSGFASQSMFTGSYLVDVKIDGGAEVPGLVGQVLMLDFNGGTINSPALGRITLGTFDAVDISPIYAGETDVIKETIRATFEQNFAHFDVTILTTDDPPPPSGTEFSVVYFGGFNAEAFGLAEDVDAYNADYCDDAIIFTESFEPRLFSADPTPIEMGIAIGNIGSHEAGHLLGLNHVDDDRALMDDASAADAFLDDQEFMEAPLSVDIMPIGTQDAVLLLEETVGPVEFFEVARTVWGIRP